MATIGIGGGNENHYSLQAKATDLQSKSHHGVNKRIHTANQVKAGWVWLTCVQCGLGVSDKLNKFCIWVEP